MGMVDDIRLWWNIITNPGKYAGKQMSIGSALKLYYEASIIPLILSLIVGLPIASHGMSLMPFTSIFISSGVMLALVLSIIVSLWIIIPIFIFINAFIYHLIGKYVLNAWGKEYNKTFVATLFGALPQLLLYWLLAIPVIDIFAIIVIFVWGAIVLIASLALQQKTTRVNAFVTLIASGFFTLIIAMILISLLYLQAAPIAGYRYPMMYP